MNHIATIPFSGDTSRAFDLAIASLTSIGFRVTNRESRAVAFRGPGMNSTRQSPLLGATEVVIREGDHGLTADAELGGVRRMSGFIRVFPIALNAFLLLTALGVAAGVHPPAVSIVAMAAGGATAVNAVLWLALSPIIARRLERRSCDAISNLLENLAAAQAAN
jgi:hypothetical protein